MSKAVIFLVLANGNIDFRETMPRWKAVCATIAIWFLDFITEDKLTTRILENPTHENPNQA